MITPLLQADQRISPGSRQCEAWWSWASGNSLKKERVEHVRGTRPGNVNKTNAETRKNHGPKAHAHPPPGERAKTVKQWECKKMKGETFIPRYPEKSKLGTVEKSPGKQKGSGRKTK